MWLRQFVYRARSYWCRKSCEGDALWRIEIKRWFLVRFNCYSAWSGAFVFIAGFCSFCRPGLNLTVIHSGNVEQDYIFSKHILFCYMFSYLIGTALIWCLSRMRLSFLLLPIAVNCLTSIYLAVRRPEEVIVFFPSVAPYLALLLNLIFGALGGATIAHRLQRVRRHRPTAL